MISSTTFGECEWEVRQAGIWGLALVAHSPIEHVRDHLDFCLGRCDLLCRGHLGGSAEEEGHLGDGECGGLIGIVVVWVARREELVRMMETYGLSACKVDSLTKSRQSVRRLWLTTKNHSMVVGGDDDAGLAESSPLPNSPFSFSLLSAGCDLTISCPQCIQFAFVGHYLWAWMVCDAGKNCHCVFPIDTHTHTHPCMMNFPIASEPLQLMLPAST